MASEGVSGLLIAGIILGMLGAGFVGALYGAVLFPVTYTETSTLVITETSYITHMKTIKGDETDYLIMVGEVGRLLRLHVAAITPWMQKHEQGLITDLKMAEVFENSSKSIDILIELALKNPPPEKYLKDYQNLIEGLMQLKTGYIIMAQGLRKNDNSLKSQGAQLTLEAWNKLKPITALS